MIRTANFNVEPITPEQVVVAKQASIPAAVLQAFNELIIENWDGTSAVFSMDEAEKRILQKSPKLKAEELYERGWMDVEPIYRRAGWSVAFDKPAYNDVDAPATYEFRRKRKSRG